VSPALVFAPPPVAIPLALPTTLAILSPASSAAPAPEPISAFARVPVPTTDAISPSAPAPDGVATEDYVIGPEDVLAVSHSNMVHVMGSVSKPGPYPLNRPLTVVELLVRAGGFAEFGKHENVIIMRYEGGTTSRLLFNYPSFVSGENMEQNILLRNRERANLQR